MAQTMVITDDLNGATPAETYYFIVGDKEYAVDLGEDNAKDFQSILAQFEEKMAPYIRAGRSIGKANPRRSTSNKPSYDAATVRIWANENGYEVSDRGRIPADILEAYENRNKKN
ncbi:Lsr2 family protein [Micrococcus luteus]|uniref:histone-like nucleoid-structuring protein Lsr2 n=2 Tax=Micrococcus luteus TaxID=1270 RepID=UPI00381B582E